MILLALLLACEDPQLVNLDAEVSASPLLVDLGDVPVGETRTGGFQLDAVLGSRIGVTGLTLTPLEGEGWTVTTEVPFVLDRGTPGIVSVAFTPPAPGFAAGRLAIDVDADSGPLSVDLRARGVIPEVRLVPPVIDLGRVAVGEQAVGVARLVNTGVVDVTLTALTLTAPTFSPDVDLPVVVAAGSAVELPILFRPVDDGATSATLTAALGGFGVPDAVLLRANDCATGLPDAFDADGDGVSSCGPDCDDGDPLVGPGRPERVNGVDDDCDGEIDEGTAVTDDDGDGRCEATRCADGSLPGDCNDGDPNVHVGHPEIDGNGVDDDCDGDVDQGSTDADGDGYGPTGGDCDDGDPTRYPGAPETRDGDDDDCDGEIDEGTAGVDDDGDGYCDDALTCDDGSLPGDCDDTDPAIAPGVAELPNRRDDDCDGAVDEGTIYADDDGDGFTEQGGDCDDGDAGKSPALGTCP